jgi:hypothetical protein
LDGGKVALKFLFRAAFAQTISLGDAIVVEIPGRFFLLVAMLPFRPVAAC